MTAEFFTGEFKTESDKFYWFYINLKETEYFEVVCKYFGNFLNFFHIVQPRACLYLFVNTSMYEKVYIFLRFLDSFSRRLQNKSHCV